MADTSRIRRFAGPEDYTRNFIVQGEIDKYLPGGRHFIDDARIHALLDGMDAGAADPVRVREIVAKSERSCETLLPEETAELMKVTDPALFEEMRAAADRIKHKVYDNRIVVFAPLYMSNLCVNGCRYCGFRDGNSLQKRRVLTMDELRREVDVLAGRIGHKRLIAVYGEHPSTSTEYIAETIETCYATQVKAPKTGAPVGIRRVNVNAAPLPVADLKVLRSVGIGTFQVFQETYNREKYLQLHPTGPKSNYEYHTEAMDRAQEGGCDDVGVGVLFGLAGYKYELVGLLMHAEHLEARFGVGPHTISVPRICPADDISLDSFPDALPDHIFRKIVAVLRVAVPYTGMIVSTRESVKMREQLLDCGISQVSGGSRTSVGGYTTVERHDETAQFDVADTRPLDDVVRWLLDSDHIPSFCTACYREGRTGDRFMSLCKSGKISLCCTPNALMTLKEYLVDYASPSTREAGERMIARGLGDIPSEKIRSITERHLREIEQGKRDFRF